MTSWKYSVSVFGVGNWVIANPGGLIYLEKARSGCAEEEMQSMLLQITDNIAQARFASLLDGRVAAAVV